MLQTHVHTARRAGPRTASTQRMWTKVGVAATVGVAAWLLAAQRGLRLQLVALDGINGSRVELLSAAESVGAFLILREPFISAQNAEAAFDAVRTFFAQNDTYKSSLPVVRFGQAGSRPGPIARGYIPFGGESGLSGSFFEAKEGFAYSFDCLLHSDAPDSGPANVSAEAEAELRPCNAWPAQEYAFRETSMRVLQAAHAAAIAVGVSLAEAYGACDGGAAVRDALDDGAKYSVMRLFHYHSRTSLRIRGERRKGRGLLGSSPHTDWHVVTVIAEDGPGLELRRRGSRRWQRVAVRPNEFVVIVGDMLDIASGGRLHSPVHRVLLSGTSGGRRRTSFTLFAYPRFSDSVAQWQRMLAPCEASDVSLARELERTVALGAERARSAPWNTLLKEPLAVDDPVGRVFLRKWLGVSL